MAMPPPVHKGRKGGFLWEELLRELPKEVEALPFYRDSSGVEAAEARQKEMMEKMKTWNKSSESTELYDAVRSGKKQFVRGEDSVKEYLNALMQKEILIFDGGMGTMIQNAAKVIDLSETAFRAARSTRTPHATTRATTTCCRARCRS